MKTQKIFSILLFLIGEILIVICFLYFGRNLGSDLLSLNIVVSTIIFSLFFLDIFFPLVDFKAKGQKTVGSLGILWFFRGGYMLLAIGAMLFFNLNKPVDFGSQVIIHGIIFFVLCIGLYFAFFASEKVGEVNTAESKIRGHLEEMIQATREVRVKLGQLQNIPETLLNRMEALQDNLRFISPCNTQNAVELETDFINEIKAVQNCFFDIPINDDKLIGHIQNCERIYTERKQFYSN